MQDIISLAIAIWGAILSTVLAVIYVYDKIMDKGKVYVHADIERLDHPNSPHPPDPHEKFENRVRLTVINCGRRAVQVLGIVLIEAASDEKWIMHKITPSGFPVVLEPETTIEPVITIQWLHYHKNAIWLGVVDALGRMYGLSRAELESLLDEAEQLPSTVLWAVRKDDNVKVMWMAVDHEVAMWTMKPQSSISQVMQWGDRLP